jgi:hypothetical protein
LLVANSAARSLPKTKAVFVEPMDCLPVSKLPEGANWVWEIKLDGYRAVAVKSGGAVTLGKSIFNAGEDVKGLINAAEGVSPVRQAGGNFERQVDAGRTIGTDHATGAPTSTYTVITKPNGNLVTAFPGKP